MDTYDKPEYLLTEDDRSWAADLADAPPTSPGTSAGSSPPSLLRLGGGTRPARHPVRKTG
jgi:hypothetical protein